MSYLNARRLTAALTAATISLVVLCLSGCPGREIGTRDQISVSKHRVLIDDSEDVVRVVGLARNTGDLPTPEAEIVATLRSRTGSFKGENRVAIEGLPAGGEQQFSLAINSHGSVQEVEMQVVEPGTVTEEGGEEGAPDAAEEGDDDGS